MKTTGGSATVNNAGYNVNVFEIDSGSLTGTPYRKSALVSEDARLNVGMDTPMFDYSFNATAQNTAIWRFSAGATAMAATQASGSLTLNSGSVLTTQAACSMSTWRSFPIRGNASQHVEMTMNISATPVANQVLEFGYFFSTATGATPTAPTDGVYFQLTSAGLIGVMNYNGTVTQTGTLVAAASIPLATKKVCKMLVAENVVEFWYGGALAGEISVPAGNSQPFLTTALPITFQARNSGTVTGTPCLMRFSELHVDQNDLNLNNPYPVQQSAMGLSAYQGQDGGTMGSTAIYSNAALAAAAALTNTTAAAGNTGLGGMFLVLPTLTAGTDGILCSFLNPVGGVNQTPRTLIINSIAIDSVVQVALTGGPLALGFGAAFGHTALSLATTETASFVSPSAKAPRRVPLGVQGIAVTAAVGVSSNEVVRNFQSPIVVNPGEYFAITMRNSGTVTTAGALLISVCIDGYFQ
jgi:hypothetical protein